MLSQWHRLPSQAETLPPLLFQYTWTREGYEVYLTDLTSLWSETLRHKDILERAERLSTTIDPSEGDDQLDLLFNKIGGALGGVDGKSTLNSGSHDDSIEINISAKLPAPLKPLRWTLNLSKEPASSFTACILLPLLKDEAAWESREQTLLAQLKQKDWVLGKLFDRSEAIGVDMISIFPSAGGLRSLRKGGTRHDVSKVIKGVTPFDEKAWLAESKSSSENCNLASNIVHEIFGSDSKNDMKNLAPVREQWWDGLEKYSELNAQEEAEASPPKKVIKSTSPDKETRVPEENIHDGDDAADTTDSEFERYEGPPRGRSSKKTSKESPTQPEPGNKPNPKPEIQRPVKAETQRNDDFTATESDSDDLDSAPVSQRTKKRSISPKPKAAEKPTKRPLGRLGVIGGKKKQPEEPQPSPPPQITTPELPKPAEDESENAHETAPAPSPVKTKKPSKLGVIGGKNKTKNWEISPPEPPTQPQTRHSPTDLPKRERESPEKVAPIPPKKEPVSRQAARSPQPEETEAEKASRRREELKRQLEAQSKAPAKKKRRF